MPDELERQLGAFGLSLEAETGEAIASRSPADRPTGRPNRRWWSIAGAAACLVAVVVGLIALTGRDADAPATPPPAPTTTSSADTDPVPDDPLGLEQEGWTLIQRTTEPFVMSADELPCADPESLEQLNGVDQVHDILTPPNGAGLDLDITVLDVGSPERGLEVAKLVAAIGQCIAEQGGIEVEPTSLSSIRASWFRAGPDFALVAVVGEGPRSIVLEIENEPFDDDLIADLAHRADRYLRGGDPTADASR